ncbi:hypothetical protein M8C21_032174, partial [Ambrosia artemisiifolia]
IDTSKNFTKFLDALNENSILQLQNRLRQKIQEGNHEKITIIHDNSMYFVEEVARNLNVPSIVLRSCSASYVPAFLALPKLHAQGELPVKDSMLQKLVPDLYPLRYKDLPFNKTSTEVITEMHALSDRIRTPSAIIWNTMDFLESLALTKLQQLYQIPIFAIGPLNETAQCQSTSFLTEDTNCISWLDKQAPRSVIYVSLGSLATINEKELVETAWGLAESNQPFIWVVRPGSVEGSEWIDKRKRSSAEMGTTETSIGSSCGWRRRVIVSVIRRLLGDDEGEEIRKRANNMKEKVKYSLSKGGSSFNSLNNLVQF